MSWRLRLLVWLAWSGRDDDDRKMKQAAAIASVIALVVAAVIILVVVPGSPSTSGALCHVQTKSVANGAYVVQSNEYGSSGKLCVSVGDDAAFQVTSSSVGTGTSGLPAAFPSVYAGCHWGVCTSGGLAAQPVQVAALNPGMVKTSWSTSQSTAADASYDATYDIWFNGTPTTKGQPDCAELMVWLGHGGSVQPYGTVVASGVRLGGTRYDVWAGRRTAGTDWQVITYDMSTPVTAVRDLDVGLLAQDAASRGYLPRSCYLISVEAGFGLWRGGAGLATTSYSVTAALPPRG